MSTMGTGAAAGVAQTAQQAQQIARRRERRQADAVRDSERVRDVFEAHMQALDEGNDRGSHNRAQIDDQVPDHEGPPPLIPYHRQPPVAGKDAPGEPASGEARKPRLDVQA